MSHTPGPWRFELNEKSKTISLVGGRPTFDKTVMDFVRYGMGHGAPRFNEQLAIGSDYHFMERCEKFAVVAHGREHHADWFKLIDHPDARLIEAAPELLEALQSAEMALAGYLHQNEITKAALLKARAAIEKATSDRPSKGEHENG